MATEYTILHKLTDEDDYGVLPKTYEASSSTSAVRLAATDIQQGGTYVAIPARSFDPVKIELEAQPRVRVVK